MARRNPGNPRYQKGVDVGKTRRSAASAKPKRAAGDSSADSSKKSRKKKRKGLFAPVPATPEYRRWRRIWLGVLAGAIVFSLLAWWRQQTPVGNVALVVAYACIFTAFYIDFFRLRRLRKSAIETDKAGKSGTKKDDRNGKDEKSGEDDRGGEADKNGRARKAGKNGRAGKAGKAGETGRARKGGMGGKDA